MLDFVEAKILKIVPILFFLIFVFLKMDLGMKILLFSGLIFFLTFFYLCTYWAGEWHPERKFKIGFLVSFFHTFFYLFCGFLGYFFALLVLKFFPFLINYLRGIFPL